MKDITLNVKGLKKGSYTDFNLLYDMFHDKLERYVFDYMDYCDTLRGEDNDVLKIDYDMFLARIEHIKQKFSRRQREIFQMNKEQDKWKTK